MDVDGVAAPRHARAPVVSAAQPPEQRGAEEEDSSTGRVGALLTAPLRPQHHASSSPLPRVADSSALLGTSTQSTEVSDSLLDAIAGIRKAARGDVMAWSASP